MVTSLSAEHAVHFFRGTPEFIHSYLLRSWEGVGKVGAERERGHCLMARKKEVLRHAGAFLSQGQPGEREPLSSS